MSHRSENEEHSASFGFLEVFVSLGYLLAPMIAGFLVFETVGTAPLAAAVMFLAISAVLLVLLLAATRHIPHYCTHKRHQLLPFVKEVRIWRKLGHRILPVLTVTLLLNIVDGFYWTIGPLFASTLTDLGRFEGVFMASHTLPALFIGWIVGSITIRYGQKKTAIAALFFGSLILCSFLFIYNEYMLIVVNFIVAFCTALAAPSIAGAYADYITEAGGIATEIETMEDLSTNSGYVIGPIMAGVLSDLLGYKIAFACLGVAGVCITLLLWHIVPKRINVASLSR